MKTNLLLLLFLLAFFEVKGQTDILGRIEDKQSQPMAYVNVLLFSEADSSFIKGVVSQEDGIFSLTQVPQGIYYLEISMVGYQTVRSGGILLQEGGGEGQAYQISESFVLAEDAELLEEIVIQAKKPFLEQQIDRTVVNVQSSITSAGSNALEILERSPGIEIDRVNNQISMQGKSGVMVMLNGKLMRMEMAGLIQLLQSLPSDNLEKIELITTPPASFDAQGDAGIINIVTIKREDEGTNANLSLQVGYGARPKTGGSLNWNYRKKKLNLYGDFSGNYDLVQQDFTIDRRIIFNENLIRTTIHSDRPASIQLYNGRIGLDYALSPRTDLGVLVSGYLRDWDLDAQTLTTVADAAQGTELSYLRAQEINTWSHLLSNISLTHRFGEKSRFTFNYDYLLYWDDNPTQYDEDVRSPDGLLLRENQFESTKRTPIDIHVTKLDWAHDLTDKFNVAWGLKGTYSQFENDVALANLEDGEKVFDPRFTDDYEMEEYIGAAYLSARYTFHKKWNAQAGLRYEYYDSHLKSEMLETILVQEFGRWFPSVFLSYQIKENHQLQWAYSERITRPAFTILAPAFFFWGVNTVLAGNPTVVPTTSRNFKSSYQHKDLVISLEYTDYENPISYQPVVVPEENLNISRAENMANLEVASFNVSYSQEWTKWWESRWNVSAYWQKSQPIVENQILNQTNRYVTLNAVQNFTLPKDFGLEFTTNYRSAQVFGFGRRPGVVSMNLGLQKKLGENTKLSLSWNDMFNLGSFFNIIYDEPQVNIYNDWNYNLEGNIFRLSVSWNLGNTQLKKASRRQTGSVDERNRVN